MSTGQSNLRQLLATPRLRIMDILVVVFVLAVAGLPAMSASAAPSTRLQTTPIGALLATLDDPGSNHRGPYFGWSVAVSGNIAVVGAPDANAYDGAAYIFVRGASGWSTTPTATLSDPRPGKNEQFGYSVAVSAETVVVGAPNDRVSSPEGYAKGFVYIYVKGSSGWPTMPTTSLSNPTGNHRNTFFGISVAVSKTTAIVGAYEESPDVGAAYIYVEGESGWPTVPTTTLLNPTPSTPYFGESVAMSGTTAVVGATYSVNSVGAAYIYENDGSGWPATPTASLSDPSTGNDDRFGWSVAVSGETVMVSAPGTSDESGAAYIYVQGSSGWPTTPTTTLSDPSATANDGFGSSVAISKSTAVVGAFYTNFTGAAYFFVQGSSGWPTTPTTTLSDPAPPQIQDAKFGYSVAVSNTTALVGAPNTKYVESGAGAAYIYEA